MFSLLFHAFRWSVILALAAALTLAALLVRIDYQGEGRLQIGLKERPGLEGTLLFGGAGQSPLPGPHARLEAAAQNPDVAACERTRRELEHAVAAYTRITGRPMASLEIFALLDAEVIRELPACSRGGVYASTREGAVRCSLHGG
jgi:hypothetical protein